MEPNLVQTKHFCQNRPGAEGGRVAFLQTLKQRSIWTRLFLRVVDRAEIAAKPYFWAQIVPKIPKITQNLYLTNRWSYKVG